MDEGLIKMEIKRTTDIQEVLKCLPFEREVRNKGRDNTRESKALLFIQSQLYNPLFGVWIAYDDNENVAGYAIAVMNLMPGDETLHVIRIYAKQRDLLDAFWDIARQWAKEFKVKTFSLTAKKGKHVRAFQRRFGFVPVSVNMERRI